MWLMLLGAACDGGPAGETGCGDAVEVEVGASEETESGVDAFVAVPEGTGFTIVHGPQGGWHLLAAARVSNSGDIVTIGYTVTVDALGAVVSDNSYRVQLVEDGACAGYYGGMYGFLDVSAIEDGDKDTPPELLADQALTITMTATDMEGRTGQGTLNVVGVLDAADL